jgi:hypothetical protein
LTESGEQERGTWSEFIESYFGEVFCKVQGREGANGAAANNGDRLVNSQSH